MESIPDGIVPFRVETPSELALLMEALTASTTPTSSEVGIGVGGPARSLHGIVWQQIGVPVKCGSMVILRSVSIELLDYMEFTQTCPA